MEPKKTIFDINKNSKFRIVPATITGKSEKYYKIKSNDEILDGIDIRDIESYLRRKKLQNLEGVK